MNATVLILLAVVGFIIAVVIYLKGKKSFLGLTVGIMSILIFVVGFNGYKEIKRDAYIYYPMASGWLEAQNNSPGVVSKTGENKLVLSNYSIYCIYYSSDNLKAVVYVELPSSQDNLVMAFNRANKKLDEVSIIPKKMKPEPNLQNKLDPAIFFY